MGALNGTLTYKLFYVHGDLPKDWKTLFVENVKHRAFEPLDPEEEDEERYGWVPIETPLKVEFNYHVMVYDHFLNISLRHDKYAVPGGLLKAHVAQAEREYMLEHKKERLSRFEREDIKAVIRNRLKSKTLPRMNVIDMSWDLDHKCVRFWSQSTKNCELFQGLFEDTFALQLMPANPYMNALQLGLSMDEEAELQMVEPSIFIRSKTH